MKINSRILLIFILFIGTVASSLYAIEFPKPVGYMNDFAGVLSNEQATALNNDLNQFTKETKIEIAVATVNSLEGMNIEDYARELGNTWAVGNEDKNGIVFLIAPNDHKMRIEIASGINRTFTDPIADSIRDHTILPLFKSGEMALGIIQGAHEIMAALGYQIPPQEQIVVNESVHEIRPNIFAKKDSGKSFDLYLLIPFGVAALILAFFVYKSYLASVRENALKSKNDFKEELKRVMQKAKNPDVSKESLKLLKELGITFSFNPEIFDLDEHSEGVNWPKMQEKIDSLKEKLRSIELSIEREINFAHEARTKGPKLLKQLPETIEKLREKLKKGKPSKRAEKYLDDAEEQYRRAQQQSNDTTDWLILYAILSNSQSSCANAQEVHSNLNAPPAPVSSYRSSSSSSDSSSSSSSMDFGGFSGGGGFDGGGSSGSW